MYYALIIFYDVCYQQGQVSYQENNKIAFFPFYYLLIGNYTCIMNFSRTIPTNYPLHVRFVWHKRKFIGNRHASVNIKSLAAPFNILNFSTIAQENLCIIFIVFCLHKLCLDIALSDDMRVVF